jgi:hypothetical protein
MKHSDRVAYRKKARIEYGSEDIEVDNDAKVSGIPEEGAWVQAWVWVVLHEPKETKK